eukprot:6094702-Pyramimonas_sp.AAC.1
MLHPSGGALVSASGGRHFPDFGADSDAEGAAGGAVSPGLERCDARASSLPRHDRVVQKPGREVSGYCDGRTVGAADPEGFGRRWRRDV